MLRARGARGELSSIRFTAIPPCGSGPSRPVAWARSRTTKITQSASKLDFPPRAALGYLFAAATESFLEINNVRRTWKKSLGVAKVGRVRLYDNRRTHFSQRLSAGASVRAIAAGAGHANPTMPLCVYAHAIHGGDELLAATADSPLQGTDMNGYWATLLLVIILFVVATTVKWLLRWLLSPREMRPTFREYAADTVYPEGRYIRAAARELERLKREESL